MLNKKLLAVVAVLTIAQGAQAINMPHIPGEDYARRANRKVVGGALDLATSVDKQDVKDVFKIAAGVAIGGKLLGWTTSSAVNAVKSAPKVAMHTCVNLGTTMVSEMTGDPLVAVPVALVALVGTYLWYSDTDEA